MLKNLRGLLYNLPRANKKGDVCDGCGTFHNQKVSEHAARNRTIAELSCFWQPPDHILKWQIEKITDLNAPVLLCSTSRHQTLDVDASISHTGVYSSLLDYKQVISQSNRPVYSVPWKPWKNTLTQHVGIQVTCYLLAFPVKSSKSVDLSWSHTRQQNH